MKIVRTAAVFLIVVVIAGCARIGAPEGGPQDMAAAQIVGSQPENGDLLVDPAQPIIIEFDEAVRRETLVQAFSLSPPPPGVVRAKWKGKKLIIRMDPPLEPDKTYVLILGTQLRDMQGNSPDSSYHIAFSTGEKIDQGNIVGKLHNPEGGTQGWIIMGYHLDSRAPPIVEADFAATDDLDTEDSSLVAGDSTLSAVVKSGDPDPALEVPDATTQVGADGSWQLYHLRPGNWRVFAFSDHDSDRLWTPGLEPLAVPSRDFSVVEDSASQPPELTLIAAPRPLMPFPLRARAKVRDRIKVSFDRVLEASDFEFIITVPTDSGSAGGEGPDKVAVVEEAEAERIPVRTIFNDPADSSMVHLLLIENTPFEELMVRIIGGLGTADTLDTTLKVSFAEASELDTFPPSLLLTKPPEDGRLHAGMMEIELLFDKRMSPPGDSAIVLTAGEEDTLQFEVSPVDRFRILVKPLEMPESGILRVDLYGIGLRDVAGNALMDSLKTLRFGYLPADSLGVISGVAGTKLGRMPLHLRLISFSRRDLTQEQVLEGPGSFEYSHVPAGNWRLEGWGDADLDGKWSSGRPTPFKPSDPYVISPDTIFVRARWESAGVELILE